VGRLSPAARQAPRRWQEPALPVRPTPVATSRWRRAALARQPARLARSSRLELSPALEAKPKRGFRSIRVLAPEARRDPRLAPTGTPAPLSRRELPPVPVRRLAWEPPLARLQAPAPPRKAPSARPAEPASRPPPAGGSAPVRSLAPDWSPTTEGQPPMHRVVPSKRAGRGPPAEVPQSERRARSGPGTVIMN